MNHDTLSSRKSIPWLGLALTTLVVITAGWLLLRRYTSPGARECVELYRDARAAADTARIDTTVVPSSRTETDPRSCGSMRLSSRWQ